MLQKYDKYYLYSRKILQNKAVAQRVAELRGVKTANHQKKPVNNNKTVEKGLFNRLKDAFSR